MRLDLIWAGASYQYGLRHTSDHGRRDRDLDLLMLIKISKDHLSAPPQCVQFFFQEINSSLIL